MLLRCSDCYDTVWHFFLVFLVNYVHTHIVNCLSLALSLSHTFTANYTETGRTVNTILSNIWYIVAKTSHSRHLWLCTPLLMTAVLYKRRTASHPFFPSFYCINTINSSFFLALLFFFAFFLKNIYCSHFYCSQKKISKKRNQQQRAHRNC